MPRPHLLTRPLGRWSVLLWLVQPVSILLEVAVWGFVSAPYSFWDNTISDLGAVSCASIAYPSGPVPVCSPAHAVLNGGFVIAGAALMVGAILLLRSRPGSRLATAACVLWVISGISSVVTGLVPLDVDLELHALVSTPAILLQPVALVLHATAYARRDPRWWSAVVVGVLAAGAAVVFLLRLDTTWGGLLERAAIWPVLLCLPLIGVCAGRDVRQP